MACFSIRIRALSETWLIEWGCIGASAGTGVISLRSSLSVWFRLRAEIGVISYRSMERRRFGI